MNDRRLTFIVVPDGDLETRSYEVSYGRLKILLGIAGVVVLSIAIMVASWWAVAAQAARVPGLEREVARLEEERGQVAELARTLEDVETQYERVRRMLGGDAAPEGRDPWLPPLRSGEEEGAVSRAGTASPTSWPLTETGYITQRVGGTGREQHPGLDIAVPQHSYIRAAGEGVVREAGEDPVYGLFVLVDHEDGYQSMYGHAAELFVGPGDPVARHEVIALSGSTGRSTAPHLHFEIRRDERPIDPLTLVSQP